MAAEPKPRCATCKKSIEARPQNQCFPFCSERCRLIDLGRWLGEEYRIPTEEPPDGGDDAASAHKPN